MHKNTTFDVSPGQRQLFLDDYGIAQIEHLARTMHRPDKKGAVIRPNLECGETALQTRSAPAWDPEAAVYKLWIITSTDIPGVSGTTYVESEDGLHWHKPVLRQKEFKGSLENNFVTLDPALEWPENAIMNVVYDPNDTDPARCFKGLAQCSIREPIASPDGIHWCKLDAPPIPSSDESNLSYDQQRRTFLATVKHGGPHGRSVFLSTSTDFMRWTEPELIFHADDEDQRLGRENIDTRLSNPHMQSLILRSELDSYNVDVYNMGVFAYEGLYIGLPAMYHSAGPVPNYPNTFGFHLVQLACSRDLRTWRRLGNRRPFIEASPLGAGAYDLTQLLPPSAPVRRDDELWFYYTGLKYRASSHYVGTYPDGEIVPIPGLDRDQGAICLALLRRDGFVSLDAGEQSGMFITQPFELSGTMLFVNLDATKGTLTVEALDDGGSVVATSADLNGDLPQGKVVWTQDSLADLQGRLVHLRFTLRNGSFYSYWIEE
ncbi:TPA: hypothetical protein EYN98_20420 [Candidatus Poribacteria bacterium]|nr:hypothetical protein [Candidatus Poribacteria bacterium]